MKLPEPSPYRKPMRDWPQIVDDAPAELVELVAAAMIDFGPDGHRDGADIIAALALQWIRENDK